MFLPRSRSFSIPHPINALPEWSISRLQKRYTDPPSAECYLVSLASGPTTVSFFANELLNLTKSERRVAANNGVKVAGALRGTPKRYGTNVVQTRRANP